MQAARYLNVPPWDLAERSSFWRILANDCQAAEHAAAKAMRSRP